MAGAALCEPPGADFVAGAIQNEIADARNAGFFNRRGGSDAPKLASQALRNAVCETVSGHSRIIGRRSAL